MKPSLPLILLALLAVLAPPGTSLAAEAGSQSALTLGIFPRRDAAITMRLFKPLAHLLESRLGRPVKLETAANFAEFEHRLQQGRYDLVHLNQLQYVKAHREQGYEVVVQNEEFGEANIRGAIYVRKESQIHQLGQLKGKTILFGGGPQAMMSYIVPSYLLRQAGLQKGDYQERYAVSPPNAVLAISLGQADAAGAGEVVRRLPVVTGKIDVSQLELLAVSDNLAHLPWAVHPRLGPAERERLRDLLLSIEDLPEGRKALASAQLTGLNPVTDANYDAHREIIRQVAGDR